MASMDNELFNLFIVLEQLLRIILYTHDITVLEHTTVRCCIRYVHWIHPKSKEPDQTPSDTKASKGYS